VQNAQDIKVVMSNKARLRSAANPSMTYRLARRRAAARSAHESTKFCNRWRPCAAVPGL